MEAKRIKIFLYIGVFVTLIAFSFKVAVCGLSGEGCGYVATVTSQSIPTPQPIVASATIDASTDTDVDTETLESKYEALKEQFDTLAVDQAISEEKLLIVKEVPAPIIPADTEVSKIVAQLGLLVGDLAEATALLHKRFEDQLDARKSREGKIADSNFDSRKSDINTAIDDIASLDSVSLTSPIITDATFLGNVSSDLLTFTGTSTFDGNTTFDTDTLFVDALNNRVAVGTTTTSATLTVEGDISATTATARIYDTGGVVCNVKAYGAVGDNATNDYDAIMAAINDCPEGGTVLFPMGQYRINQTIVLDKPVTLRGTFAPRWSYSSTPRSTIRANFGSFVGGAIIHVRDRTISGEASDNNGGRFENISIDGGSWGAGIEGIYFEGLVRDWKLTDVDISQTTGNGFESAVGAGSGNPRGFTIRGLSIYSADGHGFRATALNDSYLEDVLTVANALRGFYISSMGETKINNSRAAFNALEGLYIDGSSNNGGLMFTDFSTDRNDRHGVRISLTGTTTVTFNGLLTRRDGANNGGGTETPYAGVAVIGTTTEPVAPVFINGLSQLVGKDDSGNPPIAPSVGVRVTNAQYVKVDGQLWGVTDAYIDGGGNDHFIIAEDSIIKTGTAGWSTTAPPLYNNKWIATSSNALIFDGQINIGSSTDSRRLNIVAETGAGARFRDTTNDVIFDMRAEDFQGFFGTFSNHQLRFQTNNTSRLTIDTNGYIGIATTSPNYQLDVEYSGVGVVAAFSNDNGVCVADPTAGSFSCSSDKNLKKHITTIPDALARTLELRGVNYQWKNQLTDDEKFGFIAQELEHQFPELVTEDTRGFKLVNTLGLTSVLVEAIKELHDLIANLTEKIADFSTNIYATVIGAENIIAEETICIGDTCITENQLTELLEVIDEESAPTPEVETEDTSPAPEIELPENTASTTDPIATSTPETAPEELGSAPADEEDTETEEIIEPEETTPPEETPEPAPQPETSSTTPSN